MSTMRVGLTGALGSLWLFAVTACADPGAISEGDLRVTRPPLRHLFVVAHEDDDLLFMSTDIQTAIDADERVRVVYVTAGACSDNLAFAEVRERGVMAAYARMADAPDVWTLTGRPVRELKLDGRPKISLVFFRLPASLSEAGGACTGAEANLQMLWLDAGTSSPPLAITTVDQARSYTRQQLVDELASLIAQYSPDRVGTLDGTGLFGDGSDPSGVEIAYPGLTPQCYFYDHSDHFYSAVFVRAALVSSASASVTVRQYRGYNMANEPTSLLLADALRKRSAFRAYADHDTSACLGGEPCPPFGGLYDPWIERQYLAGGHVATMPCP